LGMTKCDSWSSRKRWRRSIGGAPSGRASRQR